MFHRSRRTASLVLPTLLTLVALAQSARALPGTWNADSAGDWSDTTKWTGGTVADGADNLATFSNVITADRIVNLDSNRTIGNITASDTSNNYSITGGSILELDVSAGSPVINVTTSGRSLIIGTVIVGSDGLRKSGAGDLVFTAGSNNAFTGGIDLNAGRISYSNTTNANAFGHASNVITFTGNAALFNSNGAYTLARDITINPGVTGTLSGNFGESTDVTGSVTGSGTLAVSGGSNGWDLTLSSVGNTFSGPISVTNGSGITSLTVNSLGDAAASISLGNSGSGGNFTYGGGAILPLEFNSRQVIFASTTGGNAVARLVNNAPGANTFTINTSLSVPNAGNKTFFLGGSNTGTNAFNGIIPNGPSGAVSVTKENSGRWILSNSNSYSGVTSVTGGTLEVAILRDGLLNSSIGASSNVAANLLLSNNTTLRYTGNGNSTDRLFTINGTAAGHQATIESSGTGAVNFTNTGAVAYNTTAQTRTLNLGGTNTGANTLAALIDNNGGSTVSLNKNGGGRWILTGTNTYTGNTTINGGVLQAIDGASLPTSSILQLRGGVFQSNGTFNRNVSTLAGAVNWSTSSGGFSAIGGTLNIQLNGGTGSLTWNGSSFVSTGQTLIFGSTSADSLVDFQNSINLGSSGTNNRTIMVIDNPNSTADRARISGNLTNTAAGQGIIKTGNGILELLGTNSYTGPTSVSAGTLLVNGSLDANSIVSVGSNAVLGGYGTINGAATLANLAAHTPGDGIGLQEFAGGLTYATGSSLTWELDSNSDATRGIDFDAIDVSNLVLSIDVGVNSNLVFNGPGSTVNWTDNFWGSNHDWLVYLNANAPGLASNSIFDSINVSPDAFSQILTADRGSFSWRLVGNDIYLIYSTAIPEPGSFTLLGLGMLLVARRRGRKSQA